MTSKRLGIWSLLFATAVLGQTSAQNKPVAILDRLQRANSTNALDTLQMKPWHLKLSFQLFDIKGVATESGDIEEWWGGPSLYKTVYTSPSYTATELRTNGDVYRSKGASSVPYLLELVLRQVVHPMPTEDDISGSTPDLRKETLGGAPMDCVMLSQEIKNLTHAPLGLFPTYCFDRDKDTLRVSYEFGTQLTARNTIGVFLGQSVVMDQTTTLNSLNAVTAHLKELQTIQWNKDEFVPSDELEKLGERTTMASGAVLKGLAISQPAPRSPERARANHVQGTVVIGATIGRDGRVHSMKLITVPDADLAVAALAAVRQWRYKPYLLNGEPVSVRTQLTVNFNFTRN